MDARETAPEGWVTVAAAAEALSRAGDQIDASNVSRYLARFPTLPQRKVGKFRYLDLKALAAHRKTNVLVGEKQAYREAPDPVLALQPKPSARRVIELDDEDDDDAPQGDRAPSELNQANVDLKRLKIREAQMDLDEREGRLVPDRDVLSLISGVVQTLVAELERQEGVLAASHGREVAAIVRRGRKAAQAAAGRKLLELARKHLKPALASQVTDDNTDDSVQAA